MKRVLVESATVCALAFVIFVLPLGKAPFSSRGEAREAVVVLNMFEQNNFVLPLRNGVDIPSKPPLFHWGSAAASILTGAPSEFAIRLPSALSAVLLITGVYFFGARLFGRREGLLGALILATCTEFVRSGALARVDMMFALFETAGLFLLFYWAVAWEDERRIRWWVLLSASIALACAVLAKGPVGFVLPWIIVGSFLLLRIRLRELPFLPIICSAAVTLSLAGCWYILAYKQGGQAFLEIHLMRENVARILRLKGYVTGHSSPFFFTPLLLLSGMFPWSLFVPPACIILWEQIRSWRREPPNSSEGRFLQFALIWVLVFLIVFSIASSKRSVYLLPCYPAAALLLAFAGKKMMAGEQIAQRSMRFSAACLASCGGLIIAAMIALFAVVIWGDQVFYFKQIAHLKEPLRLMLLMMTSLPWLPLLFLVVAAALVASARALCARNVEKSFLLLGFGVLALTFSVHSVVFPPIAELNSPRLFARELNRIVPPDTVIYSLSEELYPVIYYARRPIIEILDITSISQRPELFLLVFEKKLETVMKSYPEAAMLATSENLAGFGKDRVVLLKVR